MAENSIKSVSITNDLRFIWLDNTIEKNRQTRDTKTLIRQIVKGHLETFDQPDGCIDYLTDLTIEKVIFIVSNTFGRQIVPLIHDIEQIQTIYIYCKDEQGAKKWSKSYEKISGIFTNKSQLLSKIRDIVRDDVDEDSQLPMSIFHCDDRQKTLQELTTESATFMWYRVILHVLRLSAKYCNSKKEMIEECRASYHNNEAVKNKINKFEKDYKPKDAFWWYTYDTFLFRLLNRALRTQNAEIIFKFRFFINDLHNQIEDEYKKHLNAHTSQISHRLTLYRGQRMIQKEVDLFKDSVNELISMNSFFSTTSIKQIAEIFAETTEQENKELLIQSVIFTIDIRDMNCETTPFASIKNYSCNPEEHEVLFTIGAIFKVSSVEQIGKVWHVHLQLSKQQNELCKTLSDHMMSLIGSEPGPLSFGWFLYRKSDMDQAERYAEFMLKQFPPNDKEIGNAYNLLGLIYKDTYKLDKSIECYKKALEIFSNLCQRDHSLMINVHCNLGLVYLELNDIQHADEHRKQAEEKLHNSPQKNPLFDAILNRLKGRIQRAQGNYTVACEHFSAALEVKQKSLPPEHPAIGSEFNELGIVEEKMDHFDKAMEYYKKGLDICKKTLTEDHLDLAAYHTNIGRIYYKRKELEHALMEFELAVQIIRNISRDDTENTSTVLGYIEEIKKELAIS